MHDRQAGFWAACSRFLGWSESRHSLYEKIAFCLVLLGALGLAFGQSNLEPVVSTLLWCVLLFVLALSLRQGWFKLFGPVLFYDLLVFSRRTRYLLLRWGYMLLLTVIMFCVYYSWYEGRPRNREEFSLQEQARFASSFAYTFIFVQYAFALLLTPAYTAGAIAEEKEQKTLEFLLATDLRDREIVLGKLISRILTLVLILLAGLPILSALQFLGGIDPTVVLASFLCTGATVLSLASLGIWMSVHMRRARDAIICAYLALIAYGAASIFSEIIATAPSDLWVLQVGLPWYSHALGWHVLFDIRDACSWFAVGNPLVLLQKVERSMNSSLGIDSVEVWQLARSFSLFHAVVALIFGVWAVLRLRPIALKEPAFKVDRQGRARVLLSLRPVVGLYPIFWREFWIEGRFRGNWIIKSMLLILVALTFLPFAIMCYAYFFEGNRGFGGFSEEINVWVRVVSTIVFSLTHLAIAVRAASSVIGDKQKHIFEELLTTPISSGEILWGKWLGALSAGFPGLLWLSSIWFCGLIFGGLALHGILLLLLFGTLYAFVAAGVGLFFSSYCRTVMKAVLATIFSWLFLTAGHLFLASMCCIFCSLGMGGRFMNSGGEDIGMLYVSHTPTAVLALVALHPTDFFNMRGDSAKFIPYILIGLCTWIVLAVIQARLLMHRFEVVTLRERIIRQKPPKKYRDPEPLPVKKPPKDELGDDDSLKFAPDSEA